jgi:cytochrome c oxidase assembly factor CtaG
MDRRAGRQVGAAARRHFLAGCAVLAIALVSPLHALGSALFTAHMVQHELLMVAAAPLLVLGRPAAPWLFALPRRWRRAIGGAAQVPVVRSAWRFLTQPLVAFLLHAAAIVTWHLPALYGATLRSDAMHGAQHASFLVTAVLFWWSLVGHPRRARYGVAILSLFATAVYTGGLGALLTLAVEPWYTAYGEAPRAWGLTPLEDQQLGGMVMWMPGGIAYLIAALAVAAAWLRGPRTSGLALRAAGTPHG